MAHLLTLLNQLPLQTLDDCPLPSYLLGSFRRKNITFFNGKTDETTIVYWFQSKSFSIDLRLSNAQDTPITERQGWIGDTLWDDQTQLLSWHIKQSYQTRNQWPEPAQLYHMGNCILEFAPSKAYVEDWRQQTSSGLFLGLRLTHVENVVSSECYLMDGGLIITDHLMAYVQSRLPDVQNLCEKFEDFDTAIAKNALNPSDINSYETSIALKSGVIDYSTIDDRIGQPLNLDGFKILTDGQLRQSVFINGIDHFFYYTLDFYAADFNFSNCSVTSEAAIEWTNREQRHLFHHAQTIL